MPNTGNNTNNITPNKVSSEENMNEQSAISINGIELKEAEINYEELTDQIMEQIQFDQIMQ